MSKVYKTRELGRVKKYSNSNGTMVSKSVMDQVIQEIKILKILNHRNCAFLKDAFSFQGLQYLIFPYYSKFPIMSISGPLSYNSNIPDLKQRTADLIRDMLCAIKYIHGLQVVHRDIKPDNILCQDGTFILSDFGSATLVDHSGTLKESPATLGFYPPEICCIEPPSLYSGYKADLWAIGLVVWCSLFDALPYEIDNKADVVALLDTIAEWRLDRAKISLLNAGVQDRLISLLNRDPSLRSYD